MMDSALLRIAGVVASVDIQSAKKQKSKKKKVSKRPYKKNKSRKPAQKVSDSMNDMSFVDISLPQTEYSASMDISLSVNFEGNADKSALMNKFKEEIISSIETAVKVTSKSFKLVPSQLRVKPLKVNFVVNDMLSIDDEIGF